MDERQDSIRQGVGVPPESKVGHEAEKERMKRNAQGPDIGGGLGGTSDAETAPDEVQMDIAMHEALERRKKAGKGEA